MNSPSMAIGVCLSDEHALDIEAFAMLTVKDGKFAVLEKN